MDDDMANLDVVAAATQAISLVVPDPRGAI
jgi:hypothetical protein